MKTTKAQFSMFKSECKKWIKVFGMLGWKFYFVHGKDEPGAIAYCCFPDKSEDRTFTLGLNKDISSVCSLVDIKCSAFHEVMEAFLYRISYIGECRYIQREEIPEERHNIIRTLEEVVFEKGGIK